MLTSLHVNVWKTPLLILMLSFLTQLGYGSAAVKLLSRLYTTPFLTTSMCLLVDALTVSFKSNLMIN